MRRSCIYHEKENVAAFSLRKEVLKQMQNNELKNKHLTLDDRIEIQECLAKGMTFKAIGKMWCSRPNCCLFLLIINATNVAFSLRNPFSGLLSLPFLSIIECYSHLFHSFLAFSQTNCSSFLIVNASRLLLLHLLWEFTSFQRIIIGSVCIFAFGIELLNIFLAFSIQLLYTVSTGAFAW